MDQVLDDGASAAVTLPGIADAIVIDQSEGVRLDSSESFLLAVQWHPEWKVMENPFYLRIFQAFGNACRVRAAQRT